MGKKSKVFSFEYLKSRRGDSGKKIGYLSNLLGEY
jgi:hypothetical protein